MSDTAQPEPNPWKCFEAIPGLSTVAFIWQRRMGKAYAAIKSICLEPEHDHVESYPCPRDCGCWHRVILRHDHPGAVGACDCNPPLCPDLELTLSDITPLKLNWAKLGRELCRAFDLTSRFFKMPMPTTYQIGSWSTGSVPVILTIQVWRSALRSTAAELVARLNAPFIFLAPSADQYNVHVQEILSHAKAAFFPLDANLRFGPGASLQSIRPPGELFARFNPVSVETSSTSPQSHTKPPPRYALRKGLGVWHLTFDGKDAILKHERGIFYVAWLLYHPDETPIHALDLMAKIPELYRQQLGLPALVDPSTGKVAPLQSHARLQERSLALDDAQAMRTIFKKEKELEAILDDPSESEPVKAEALRELEQILEFQRQHGRRSTDNAQRAVRTVRQAITRFYERLVSALDNSGGSHLVIRPFADHIKKYLLTPSAGYLARDAFNARNHLAGRFLYDVTSGVKWE